MGAASKPVSYKYGTHCSKINQKHKQLFSLYLVHYIGVPDKIILTISKEKKMSTFEEAVDIVSNKMNKTLSNDELKEIYALYKQATVGDINTERPGMLDFKGKAKWDSWKSKEGISQDDAKEKYMAYAKEMVEKHGLSS